MIGGPLFARELLTASRSWKHYALRAGYVLLLFVLIYTAGQVVFGWQQVRMSGDVARFGHFVFDLLAVTQMALVMTLALLLAAATVSTEKDRRTLILLLMTDLTGAELVIGKMLASLVGLLTVIAVSAPVFGFLRLLGGVTLSQIFWLELLCVTAGLLVASWATLVAYWKEKTFQTLAIGTLGAVGYLVVTGAIAVAADGGLVGYIAGALNPFFSLRLVLDPLRNTAETNVGLLVAAAAVQFAVAAGLLAFTCAKVRIWNPSRVVHMRTEEAADGSVARAKPRSIWDRPVVWREMKTRAYGTRVYLIKGVYLLLAVAAFWYGLQTSASGALLSPVGLAFLFLALISLVLANAQAVTSITTERDGQTLELLLATEVSVREFVAGKAVGTLWNVKELVLAPLVLLVVAVFAGDLGAENAVYVGIAYLALAAFSVVLGLHFGLNYGQSRQAIAGSLGTLLFLFIGIFVCMLLIIEGRSSFALQFAPFLVFILGGAVALWYVLTSRQPSPALTIASAILPFSTFYAIVGFVRGDSLGVGLFVTLAYGFATIAMLIPALSESEFALEAVKQ